MTGSDGLKIDSGERQFEIPAIEAAQVYRHSIKVTPTAEGFYLLTLSVSLQHDQTSESRVFSVPILVGSASDCPRPSRLYQGKSPPRTQNEVEPERIGPIQPTMGGFVSRFP